jgi:hypothetical protein
MNKRSKVTVDNVKGYEFIRFGVFTDINKRQHTVAVVEHMGTKDRSESIKTVPAISVRFTGDKSDEFTRAVR